MKNNWTDCFVKELSYKVKYFCCGQYEEHSVEMDAFNSGVNTAIGMMTIDLLGGVKQKGMLEKYTDVLLAEQKKELMEKIEQYKNYYNPVGDELNKGKHIACDELLESLKYHE